MTVLRAEGLEKRFGAFAAVDGVDLAVEAGEHRGLIGPNGAGKTTLFDLLSGLVAPTAGRVYFLGEDVTRTPAHVRARRGLARALQITSVFEGLSVEENALGAANGRRRLHNPFASGQAGPAARERARDALSRVGLADAAGERAADLSHGEKRLLEIALALAGDPELLLLDEPTAGLSAGETREVTSLIGDLEVAVLLVEHDMDVVMGTVDRLTVLHRGSVIAEGTPDEIRDDERVRDVYFGREA